MLGIAGSLLVARERSLMKSIDISELIALFIPGNVKGS